MSPELCAPCKIRDIVEMSRYKLSSSQLQFVPKTLKKLVGIDIRKEALEAALLYPYLNFSELQLH